MENNAIIGFPRWTQYCKWGGGAWQAEYPIANAGVLPLSMVARSADLDPAKTKFSGDLDEYRPVQLLALVGHNLTPEALVRVRLFDDFGNLGSVVYDSGWYEVWEAVYPPGVLEWEDPSFWSGHYPLEEIRGYPAVHHLYLENMVRPRSFQVEIKNENNPDGYIDIGSFEIAQGWQLSVNFDFGAEYGFRFRTDQSESLGGVKQFSRKDKPRQFNGTVPFLPREEAQTRAFEWLKQQDLDQPFLWVPNPNDKLNAVRNTFLGTLNNPGLLSYAALDRDAIPISIEEVV